MFNTLAQRPGTIVKNPVVPRAAKQTFAVGGLRVAEGDRRSSGSSLLPALAKSQLLQKARQFEIYPGQLILDTGSESTEVYLILSGHVHVTLFAPSGREVSIRDIGAGELFGELAAIDGGARSATVVAATHGRLAIVSARDFRQVIGENSEFALWLLERFAAQVRALTERVFELSALPVRGRLQCELLRLAVGLPQTGNEIVIEPAPTHAEFANRIGSQREVVTRELAYLSDHQILRLDRRKITVLDLHRLVSELRRSTGEPELPSSPGTKS